MWFCFCAGMSSATLWWRAWRVRGEGRRMGVIQLPFSCVQGTDTVLARFQWAAQPSVGPRGGGRPRRHGFGQEVRRTGYVPKAQHKSLSTLQECPRRTADRPEVLRPAYRECGITMTATAKELRLSVSRTSRWIAVAEMAGCGMVKRQDLTQYCSFRKNW